MKKLLILAVFCLVVPIVYASSFFENVFVVSSYSGLTINNNYERDLVGDFNGDGKADFLAVTGTGTGTGAVSINYSTGDGFIVKNYSGLTINNNYERDLIGDFNGDGKADLLAVTGTGRSGTVSVNYFTDSGSTVANYKNMVINESTKWAYIGDFNGDGRDDFLAVTAHGNGSGAVVVNYSTGSGFVHASNDSTGLTINSNNLRDVLGDFNGDGKLDLLAVTGTGTGTGTVSINYSTGTGFTVKNYSGLTINNNYERDVIGDFNGDGKSDFLAVTGTGRNGTASVNYSTGNGFKVENYGSMVINESTKWALFGDLNGDGKTDLLAVTGTGIGTGTLVINYSTGSGFIHAATDSTGLAINGNNVRDIIGDFNGDGKLDLLAVTATGTGSGGVSINYLGKK